MWYVSMERKTNEKIFGELHELIYRYIYRKEMRLKSEAEVRTWRRSCAMDPDVYCDMSPKFLDWSNFKFC